jgi:hypothetical protein
LHTTRCRDSPRASGRRGHLQWPALPPKLRSFRSRPFVLRHRHKTTGADSWVYLFWIRSALGCANGQASADSFAALTPKMSPGKVQNLPPRAYRLYLMRLDDFWASLFLVSSAPAPGLPASSCSCGREFAAPFFWLRLAVTPCVSLRLPSSVPTGWHTRRG